MPSILQRLCFALTLAFASSCTFVGGDACHDAFIGPDYGCGEGLFCQTPDDCAFKSCDGVCVRSCNPEKPCPEGCSCRSADGICVNSEGTADGC